MTDSIGKNASMNADDCPWTAEEIDEMTAEDTLIEMKRTACAILPMFLTRSLVNLWKKIECPVNMVKLK